ncbi:gas vesicle protein GvpC [Egbenema bharatensis]|uniref:gas vesicle protein GvpC n=1 Tax=Egbenema bharatensis TaxID=3463334 RepID=UPI003A8A6D4A
MVSLQDSWQAGRQQRQQEVLDRQQHVRHTLQSFQQERQAKTAELREELRLFQLGLQLETQDFLADVADQRQMQAAQLAEHLQAFVQTLRQQTAELISLTAADRIIMAQQLAQDLSEFHGNLTTSVTLLRQTLQHRIQEIQQEVHTLLQTSEQQRIQEHLQRMQALEEWVNTLRSSVQSYLSELELIRFDRAQQLQVMLQQEHDRRTADVNDLFQELAQFREELTQYCSSLRESVWGSSVNESSNLVEPQSGLTKRKPSSIPALTATTTKIVPKATNKAKTKKAVENTKKLAHRLAIPATLNQPAAKPNAQVVSQKSAPLTLAEPKPVEPKPVEPKAVEPKAVVSTIPPLNSEEDQLEKAIYQQIHQTGGARLTELETALGINRFQAVDALRALIKKGLVTQRDRIYLIQEDVNL